LTINPPLLLVGLHVDGIWSNLFNELLGSLGSIVDEFIVPMRYKSLPLNLSVKWTKVDSKQSTLNIIKKINTDKEQF